MTDREVMQQALEALESDDPSIQLRAAITLRAALEKPEPVKLHEAVISAWSLREVYFDEDGEPSMHRSPPQRPWVGLTDEEIAQGNKESWVTEEAWQSAVWWAEAKLKEKNNG